MNQERRPVDPSGIREILHPVGVRLNRNPVRIDRAGGGRFLDDDLGGDLRQIGVKRALGGQVIEVNRLRDRPERGQTLAAHQCGERASGQHSTKRRETRHGSVPEFWGLGSQQEPGGVALDFGGQALQVLDQPAALLDEADELRQPRLHEGLDLARVLDHDAVEI